MTGRRDDGVWFLLVIGLVLGAILTRACETLAEAQVAPHIVVVGDRRDAARCLVAEADGGRADVAAIVHVLARRAAAHGGTLASVARTYCALYRTTPRARTVEILALPDVGSATRRAQYDAARKALEDWSLGVLEDPCTEAATDWGDRHGDSERARRAGWHPVECPGTRNAYWIATRRAGAVPAELARGAR